MKTNSRVHYYFVQFSKYSDYFLFRVDDYIDNKCDVLLSSSDPDYYQVKKFEREFALSEQNVYDYFYVLYRNCYFEHFKLIKKYFSFRNLSFSSTGSIIDYLRSQFLYFEVDNLVFGVCKPATTLPAFHGLYQVNRFSDHLEFVSDDLF